MADLIAISAALAVVLIPVVCARFILSGQAARPPKASPEPLKKSR